MTGITRGDCGLDGVLGDVLKIKRDPNACVAVGGWIDESTPANYSVMQAAYSGFGKTPNRYPR